MSKHLDIIPNRNTQRFIWKVRKCTRYKCRVHFSFRRNEKAPAIFKVENGKCLTVPYSVFSVVGFSAPTAYYFALASLNDADFQMWYWHFGLNLLSMVQKKTDTFQHGRAGGYSLVVGEGLLAIVPRRQVHKWVADKASLGEV